MNILIITPPGSGQMIPHLNLSQKLAKRGHDVTWAIPRAGIARVEKAGFKVIEAGDPKLDFENRDLYCPGHSKLSGWDEFMLTGEKLIIEASSRIVKDVIRSFPKPKFSVIIADVSSPSAAIISKLWNIPWITVSTISLSLVEDGIPPYCFEDEKEEGRPITDFINGHKKLLNKYNKLRKEFGLPPVKQGWNDFHSKFLTLCVSSPDLEYPRKKFREGLFFVGALSNITPDPNLETNLQGFIERFEPKTVLYATLGTVFNKHPGLMEIMIKGVFKSGVPTVISTGPGYKVPTYLEKQKPDNILIVPWVNHRSLFPHLRAALTHGGMSTTTDTISFGLPTLHIPVGCDLPSLSRKIVAKKSGLRVSHKCATPENIAENINQLVNSEELQLNVKKLQKSFLALGGVKRAVDLIEAFVRG